METIKQQLQSAKAMNQLSLNEQEITSSRLVYKNFATKPSQSFLGISIQKERLYVIQKKTISVFQHFVASQTQISQKAPFLIKEIFLPFEISKYIITEKYICIKSKNKTQIRDNEFEKVFYSQNKGILSTRTKTENQDSFNSNNFSFDSVQELELECEIVNDDMVSWKVLIKRKSNNQDPRCLREYWSERYNILTNHKSIIKCKTQMIDPTNKNRKFQICKSPVFINQLGYIQNFYIWPVSSNDIQIGIFFNQKQHENVTENALYEICSFQLKETNIKNIFYYDFKGTNTSGKSKDGPHLFLAVCENPVKEKSKIKIVIFEILPQQKISNDESENEALNNYLDQFNQLKKQKKFQQSISNSILLNELLNNEDKSSLGSNPNKPTTVIESFTIRNSCSLKKVFYNPSSKVLWINDNSDLVYKIKFIESGDIKDIKQKSNSFIENIEGFENGENGPDLEGIMYDNYPIFKVKALALQIGIRCQNIDLHTQVPFSQQNESHQVEHFEKDLTYDQKEVIQFDDKELEKIDLEKSQQQMLQTKNEVRKEQHKLIEKQVKQVEIQTDEEAFEQRIQQENKPQLQSQQTQTQADQDKKQPKEDPKQSQIQINNLSQLLKELNFNKVQDVLIRFSTLFTANVTKNVNKLKDFNSKAKQQIKLKINGDIFELIKEVFSSIMNQAFAQKIQKEVGKTRDFVEKIFNKHLEHFNLIMLEQKIKEENVKKHILGQQLRSIAVIKEASLKFLDVTKVREMQKIAYNQVIVESIRQVGQKIENLHIKVDQMFRQSEEAENKIITDVREIKETFKLIIDLEENLSQDEENKNADEESSESGFQSQEEEEESQEERDTYRKQVIEQKKVPHRPEVQYQQYPYMSPPVHAFNQRPPGWNSSFYQGPANYPYPSYSSPLPPANMTPHYPPVQSPFTQPYHPHQNPYESAINSRQQQFFPPPYSVHPSYNEIRAGSQNVEDQVKAQKKKKSKPASKHSSSLRNQ